MQRKANIGKNWKIWAKNGKIGKNSDFLMIFGTLFEISIILYIFDGAKFDPTNES